MDEGWNEEQGLERCPECKMLYSGNGLYIGVVWDLDGNRYDSQLDTDPTDGPFLCDDCWKEIQQDRLAQSHKTLDHFEVPADE